MLPGQRCCAVRGTVPEKKGVEEVRRVVFDLERGLILWEGLSGGTHASYSGLQAPVR